MGFFYGNLLLFSIFACNRRMVTGNFLLFYEICTRLVIGFFIYLLLNRLHFAPTGPYFLVALFSGKGNRITP